jgi:TonB family protein
MASAPADSVVSTHEQPAAVSKDAPLSQQIADVPEQHIAALTPSDHATPTKADYGWLADLMAKWIGELDKRYPTILRTEGVTGRVTLTALLHQDGILSDVRVEKSSGNTLLDQVAVEDITNGPPVKLSRPLQRPSMPVKFSIVYDLKTPR